MNRNETIGLLGYSFYGFLGVMMVIGMILVFIHGAIKQDEIQRANDCEFAQDKPFAQEWYLKNCR